MSSFTPRSWKSQAEPQAERSAEVPVGKFHAYRHGKPNNLPIASSSFIGRDRDLAEVKALLDHHRLVTLLGSGGVGKTRLAMQVGAELLDRFPEGAWFADLAPISDLELVSSVIAQALGMAQQPGQRVDEAIPLWLKGKHLLLILDNCEHVVETVAQIVAAILRAAPNVRIVATSRQPLDVAGEKIERLTSLDVPQSSAHLNASAAIGFGAVALFADRASLVDKSFALTDDAAPIVADICRRLDGIPLAIELAAARVKVLSVGQLRDKLGERFKLLTGGGRDVLPRQKTLHALIEWSYDLLNDDEKRLFCVLGIFAGSFPLDVTVAVGSAQNIDEYEVLDLLTSLVDKSLLASERGGDETRYRLLESTREFALERLAESGEFERTARAHALAFTELAEDLQSRWFANRSEDSITRSRLELDNWRAALQWTLRGQNDVALGQRLTASLRVAWARLAPSEGRRWIAEAFVATPPPESDVAARLHVSDAHLAMLLTQHKAALSSAREALASPGAEQNRRLVAEARLFAGAADGLLGQTVEGEAFLQLALTDFAELGAFNDAGSTLQYLAVLRDNAGDVSGSRAFYAQAYDAYGKAGAHASAAQMALNLAEVEFQCGDAEKALVLAQEALQSDRERGEQWRFVYDLCNMAAYEIALGRLNAAASHAAEVLSISQETGSEFGVLAALQRLVALAVLDRESGDPDPSDRDVARLLGFIDSGLENIGFVRDFTERQEYDRVLAALDEILGPTAYSESMLDGRHWPVERAVALGEAIAARFCATEVADA